jgi:hypothetical protein
MPTTPVGIAKSIILSNTDMKKIFTEHMFLLLLSTYGISYLVVYLLEDNQSYGINKTVGWAYDISNQFFFNALTYFLSKVLLLVGYLLIFLFNRKTVYHISIIHFCIIIASLISMFSKNYLTSTILFLTSMVVFFINVSKSYKISR